MGSLQPNLNVTSVYIDSNKDVEIFYVSFASFSPFREVLITPDEGHIGLDWVDNDENNEIYKRPETRPIVVILPGITGKSSFVMLCCLSSFIFLASTIFGSFQEIFNKHVTKCPHKTF